MRFQLLDQTASGALTWDLIGVHFSQNDRAEDFFRAQKEVGLSLFAWFELTQNATSIHVSFVEKGFNPTYTPRESRLFFAPCKTIDGLDPS